ncbi:MAG: PAS domain S-box protein [Cyclobacteriaceae bacterium]
MKISQLPYNENERIAAIRRHQILDTDCEKDFDDIVELAAQLCKTPTALITMVDERRQWFKAKVGLEPKETHRDFSFCAHVILEDDLMIVEDALNDERFFDNPLVTGDPKIRFYAGMPIQIQDGYKLGTLAVIDYKPRKLDEHQKMYLQILANQVKTLLNLRLQVLMRKDAEEKLKTINNDLNIRVQQKTAQITELFDRVSDAFIAVDKEGYITYANKKVAQLLKRSVEDLSGRYAWREFPEWFGSDFQQLTKVASQTQKYQWQQVYYFQNDRWFENHFYPSSTGVSIYFHDITDRKKSELASKRSEELRRLIMEAAPDAVICVDTEGNITFWNSQAEKLFGWQKNEILGQPLIDRIIPTKHHRQHNGTLKPWLQRQQKESKKMAEISAINSQNKEFPIEISITPIEQYNHEFYCVFIKDISERKVAEQKIIEEKELADSIINSLPGIFYLFDMQGKFLRWNKNWELITGYTTEEMELLHPLDLFEGQEKALIEEKIKMVFEDGMAEVEAKLFTKDELKLPFYFTGRRIIYENQICLIGMGIDIAERAAAEERLKNQFKELKKINYELDHFVYSVSHDLRAPLASILGLVNIALMDKPSPTHIHYWTLVQESVVKLDGFIKDILDYSSNSRVEIQSELIDIHQLMHEVQKNISHFKNADRLRINIEYEGKHPFYTDPTRLNIILNNLLANAVKYQDFNKEESRFLLCIESNEDQVTLKASDNGIGIQDVHLDKIFQMFYRASDQSKGSGLGLYIVQETVDRLGGSIAVSSEFGYYTEFTITLPNKSNQ